MPRTLISDLPGGFGNCSSRLNASGRCAAPPGSWRALPSLFGLAPCGVYLASGFTVGAVRSYRTISPLPRRWRFRNGERTRQARPTRVLRLQGGPPERGVAEAVSFLWHWPSMGFQTHVPDVIRHTALRSSDFPPPANRARARPPAATARSPCQRLVYPSTNLAESGRTSHPSSWEPRCAGKPGMGHPRLVPCKSLRFLLQIITSHRRTIISWAVSRQTPVLPYPRGCDGAKNRVPPPPMGPTIAFFALFKSINTMFIRYLLNAPANQLVTPHHTKTVKSGLLLPDFWPKYAVFAHFQHCCAAGGHPSSSKSQCKPPNIAASLCENLSSTGGA